MAVPVPIGVVTVSDRASRGEYEDKGGPRLETDPGACVAFRPQAA